MSNPYAHILRLLSRRISKNLSTYQASIVAHFSFGFNGRVPQVIRGNKSLKINLVVRPKHNDLEKRGHHAASSRVFFRLKEILYLKLLHDLNEKLARTNSKIHQNFQFLFSSGYQTSTVVEVTECDPQRKPL